MRGGRGRRVFYIENANLLLLGRSVTYYAVMPIVAAVVITAVNCLTAKRSGFDTSFVFRVSAVTFFCGALGQLYFHMMPAVFLPVLYIMGASGVVAAFWVAARIFKQEEQAVAGLGICSVLLFSMFSKLGCFLTGCCYGRPYEGPLRVVYGVDTVNPFPGTGRFPVQLLTALLFLVLSVIAYGVFIKCESYSLMPVFLFCDWVIYYGGTCLYDQRANQMILGGFNVALPLAIMSFIGGAAFLWFHFRKKCHVYNRKKE